MKPRSSPKRDLPPHSEELPGQGTKCYSQTSPEAKLTQNDSVDSGEQFVTPEGPRQSFLLSQGPRLIFVPTTFYTQSVHAQAHIPRFLKSALENVRKRYKQVTVMIHILKVI